MKTLLVLIGCSLDKLKNNGYTNLDRYYNPSGFFDKVIIAFISNENRVYQEYGYKVYEIKRRRNKLITYLNLILLIIKISIIEKVDILRSYDCSANGFIITFISKILNKKSVVSIHCDPSFYTKTKLEKIFFKYSLNFSHQIRVTSTDIFNKINKRYKNKTNITYNKINLKLYRPANNISKKKDVHSLDLVTVGRLVESKDHITIIKALKILKNENRIQLTIIGDGPEREKLQDYVSSNNLNNNVVFLGAIPNNKLVEYFSQSDCFVFPSISEGFGMALVEAQAAGLPIIAADIPGTKDIINNKNALLFEPQNHKQLSCEIQKLMTNFNLRDYLSKKSSESCSKFEWDFIEKIEVALYEKLLSC